jgi:hypothetical protein
VVLGKFSDYLRTMVRTTRATYTVPQLRVSIPFPRRDSNLTIVSPVFVADLNTMLSMHHKTTSLYIPITYIVLVQDFVSGLACCVNQLWCSKFTQQTRPDIKSCTNTMYVISLSNISIKTNFKQITRVELKCLQYSQVDYILCMTTPYFFRSFTNVRIVDFAVFLWKTIQWNHLPLLLFSF